MKLVKPQVHLIAKTSDVDFDEFLKTINAEAYKSNAPSMIEKLIEGMGRLCYRSFLPKLNKNVTRVREDNAEYIKNILSSGHGSVLEHSSASFVFHNVSRVFCYEEGTEILTRNGWKKIEDISDNEELLTLNPETHQSEWQCSKKLHRFDYNGPIHWFESSQWKSPGMTPDHIMWAAQHDLRSSRGLSNLENIKKNAKKTVLKDLLGKRFAIQHEINLSNNSKVTEVKIGNYFYDAELFYEWLGLMATDGHVARTRNRCAITQSKKVVCERIRFLMDSLFSGRNKEYPIGEGLYLFTVSDLELKNYIISTIGRTKSKRTLSSLFNIPENLIRKFIIGMSLGDGNVHKINNHEVIYCNNERYAKDLQVLYARIGKSSNLRISENRIGQSHHINGKECKQINPEYVLSIHNKGASLVRKSHQKSKEYSGYVYCPQTKNGLVYVRNSGMAFWSGNTHELIRHRVGVGISQESLRYVRLEDISFWVPSCFEQDEYAREVCDRVVRTCEQAQIDLAKHFKLDETKDFGFKKTITSAMRRLAPEGLATTIGWTGNMRILRHCIEMRTSRHAEEEIRLVFNQVGEICRKEWPHLFADYQVEMVDGYGEWTTPYSKV